MYTICITGYRRPKLFEQLLKSLLKNKLDGWSVIIRIEPSPIADEFHKLVEKYLVNYEVDIQTNAVKLGITKNPYELLSSAFKKGAELVLYLEEDIVISEDVTDIAGWFNSLKKNPYVCLNLIAGGCGSGGFISYPKNESVFFEFKAFNSLGFICKKEMWENFFSKVWMRNDSYIRTFANKPASGWDWECSLEIANSESLKILAPATARSNHTGRDQGEWCLPEWHDLVFEGLEIAQTASLRPVEYEIQSLQGLPPSVRRHVMLWDQAIVGMREMTKVNFFKIYPIIATLRKVKAVIRGRR